MAPLTKLISVALAIMFATPNLAAPTGLAARQLAGEGNACSSLLSGTDNGVGYGIENAEENTANALKTNGGAGGALPKLGRRQGDKIANGAGELINAAGSPQVASFVKSNGDTIDGQLTDDATNIGAQLGGDEQDMLTEAGAMIP